ncbi:hypothetical protein DICPUDRAFT_55042 [Dictyostelium purpureum]|uniref:Uncharacterized protein n=1 Tax=Dictyostelium purpureum TaxID=5786 RepID=F0ZK12_DICPU|nr:uncharacterized protein DICPUDRAFT_55042 [Dictyostelium purpureum]EGC35698.1 hypothetical protein DICPUDRAFT_55042 [Dictyostelium purpureum]|eukprot:XP_003287754.1 hypothetical protein DICPUDRAFT_55042 [Dictyostelium purpureum]
MRQQPLSRFLAQQGRIYWPFLVGAGVWFPIIPKVQWGITDSNKEQSYYWKKVQALNNPDAHKSHGHGHH